MIFFKGAPAASDATKAHGCELVVSFATTPRSLDPSHVVEVCKVVHSLRGRHSLEMAGK